MRIRTFWLLFLLSTKFFFTQETVVLNFQSYFQNEKLAFEKWYPLSEKDSILFENFKFYISSIEFYKNNLLQFKEAESFHLIDFTDSNSLQLSFKLPEKISFDEVKFNLGIDSLTNSGGVKGGDLDPTKGMYWTWQTGYIHLKLEGKSNLCPTRNNNFSFHLGGFSFPMNTMQEVHVKTDSKKQITVQLDLEKFISTLSLNTENQIMSPSLEAVKLSRKMSSLFYSK